LAYGALQSFQPSRLITELSFRDRPLLELSPRLESSF
jgi:hypothetical protein